MRKTKMGLALLLNAMIGVTLSFAFGIAPAFGAVGAIVGGALIGGPDGSLNAGVLTEIWTGELVKKLRSGDFATWLDGIADESGKVNNNVIHLVDVGADPKVLVNNTTYPISVTALDDDDISLSLDKYQTEATPVTDDELYALSYDKMASVIERHQKAILEYKFMKAIHALAPASNTATTPVLFTTGATEDGGTTGRMMITRKDIAALKKNFDLMGVPLQGRRLVLCPDHVADLLNNDQVFANQYYNYTTGKILNLYGFEIYEAVNSPVYNQTGAKQAVGTASVVGSLYQASVAFYTGRVFKATGTTKFYHSEPEPLMQRSLVNYRHYYVVLPKKQEAMAAIVSKQK